MSDLPVAEPSSRAASSGLTAMPGLRTFRSTAFRTAMALLLLLIGLALLGSLLAAQAGAEDGQYGIDFGDFHAAATRLAAGASPYAPELLAGPVDAQGVDRYRYPPLFAQLARPLAALSPETAALAWLLLQGSAVFAATWIGTGIGGARRSLERALWCGVAALYFLPVFDTLWKGNVSGILALTGVLVAFGGAAGGLGAAAGALLKAVPGTLVPAALVMDRRSRVAVVAGLGVPIVLGFLAAPGAWLDYPTVVLHMLEGSADYATNLSPATIVARAGAPDVVAAVVRLGMLTLAAACVAGSVVLARRVDGRRSAALLGTVALLLVPASLWYHYLAVLLPFAAMAWPAAGARARAALLGGAVLVSVSLAWLPLAIAGAAMLAVVSLGVLRPRPIPAVTA